MSIHKDNSSTQDLIRSDDEEISSFGHLSYADYGSGGIRIGGDGQVLPNEQPTIETATTDNNSLTSTTTTFTSSSCSSSSSQQSPQMSPLSKGDNQHDKNGKHHHSNGHHHHTHSEKKINSSENSHQTCHKGCHGGYRRTSEEHNSHGHHSHHHQQKSSSGDLEGGITTCHEHHIIEYEDEEDDKSSSLSSSQHQYFQFCFSSSRRVNLFGFLLFYLTFMVMGATLFSATERPHEIRTKTGLRKRITKFLIDNPSVDVNSLNDLLESVSRYQSKGIVWEKLDPLFVDQERRRMRKSLKIDNEFHQLPVVGVSKVNKQGHKEKRQGIMMKREKEQSSSSRIPLRDLPNRSEVENDEQQEIFGHVVRKATNPSEEREISQDHFERNLPRSFVFDNVNAIQRTRRSRSSSTSTPQNNLGMESSFPSQNDFKTIEDPQMHHSANNLVPSSLLDILSDKVGDTIFNSSLDDSVSAHNWEFTSSLLFVTSLVTTIGYGHITPMTQTGKGLAILFSVIGIPCTLVLLTTLSTLLLNGPVKRIEASFAVFATKIYQMRSSCGSSIFLIRFGFFLFLSLILLLTCFLLPAFIFTLLEKDWSYLDSLYYCSISLSTVGLGDFIPAGGPELFYYRLATVVYLFAGLTFVFLWLAVYHKIPEINLCYYLMSDMGGSGSSPCFPTSPVTVSTFDGRGTKGPRKGNSQCVAHNNGGNGGDMIHSDRDTLRILNTNMMMTDNGDDNSRQQQLLGLTPTTPSTNTSLVTSPPEMATSGFFRTTSGNRSYGSTTTHDILTTMTPTSPP